MSTDELRAEEALEAWLARIGFNGRPAPDLATLAELSRRHIAAFPYENLDVQLGRRVTRDPRDAFRKLVREARGGWCYEYNGLFAWMLELVGFRVRHLAGAVQRETAGDRMIGNHLVPVVELDRLYIADVAMGHFDPVPLVEGPIRQGWRIYSLERVDGGWWRFRNHPGQLPPSFDFSLEVEDPAILDGACEWLQSDPGSPFVRHAIIQRSFPDRMETLTGRLHSILDQSGERVAEVPSREVYEKLARDNFGVALPDARTIWARVSLAPAAGFATPLDAAA
jgi:N-hydroxyarylamine O-acetyltransferase